MEEEKIKSAVVAIAVLGGLGSNVAVSLARIGIGKLVLVDFDRVEKSNLNRQYYFLNQIGKYKTDSIKEVIENIRGIRTREIVQIMIDELDIPVIVDAGIGKPSEACQAMEMGAAAVLVNTAIATSEDPVKMAEAFAMAVKAGS